MKLIVERHKAKPEFHRAATVTQKLAELYEVEIGDNGRAAAAYEEAASWFDRVSFTQRHAPFLRFLLTTF